MMGEISPSLSFGSKAEKRSLSWYAEPVEVLPKGRYPLA